MHETLKKLLLDALNACTPRHAAEEDEHPRLDPCADENEYASRVAEVGISLCLRARMRERKNQIEGALKRLDNGNYGVCEDCGEDIGLARLMANPVTQLCVHCQRERERAPQLRCA